MNKIEKAVYDAVKGSPAVKFLLRNIYQTAFDILPTPKSVISGQYSMAENSFFGFHDKSPFSADCSMLLSLRTSIPVRMPKADEPVEIGYYDLSPQGQIGAFHHIAFSYSWNYHKGCRLQWLPDGNVMFNNRTGSGLCSMLCTTGGNVVKEFDFPIDTVSANGKMATSFSYERLNVYMPGYGYEYCQDGGCITKMAPSETGLFIADLESGTRRLLFPLSDLLELSQGMDESLTAFHYVTHTEFSPDGRFVSFLNRWVGKDYRKRHSQLVCYDLECSKTYVMPTTGMVSHYVWSSNTEIVAYCSVRERDGHVLFNVPACSYAVVPAAGLNVDGHQSMLGGAEFVTDTYPDRRRMASLYRVGIKDGRQERLAYVYSPRKFQTKDFHNHIACDLHPRVSPDSRFVCIDTVFTGKRSICVIRL